MIMMEKAMVGGISKQLKCCLHDSECIALREYCRRCSSTHRIVFEYDDANTQSANKMMNMCARACERVCASQIDDDNMDEINQIYVTSIT